MSCNNIHHTIIKFLLTAIAALLPIAPALAEKIPDPIKPDGALRSIPPKLITDKSQLIPGDGQTVGLENLLDGDDRTVWQSTPGKEAGKTGWKTFIIDISKWERNKEHVFVLMIGREPYNRSTRKVDSDGKYKPNIPTKFDLRISANGIDGWSAASGEWSGSITSLEFNDTTSHEIGRNLYSTVFRVGNWANFIRLRCQSQDFAEVVSDGNDYGICLSEIQLYDVTGTGSSYEYWDDVVPFYSDLDTWDDYYSRYSDYKYIPTLGIVDPLNRDNDLEGWFNWSYFNAEGRWTKDEDLLSKYNIHLPNWEGITVDNDPNELVKEGERQPVHTQEKQLYVLPGETIGLYPTSDMLSSYEYTREYDDGKGNTTPPESWHNPYRISMTRWYDYATGRRSEYVMSLRPDGVIKTDAGLFGGRFISHENPDGALVMRFYRPTNEDFNGAVVAADFRNDDALTSFRPYDVDKSVLVDGDGNPYANDYFIDHKNKQIIAPEYSFRALFKVRRGEDFADSISGSKSSNENYLKTVRRQVEAREGEDFHIRLPQPIPTNNEDWNTSKNPSKNLWRVVENKDPIPHSPYLYKDQSGNYKRAATCILEWYKIDENGKETPVYTNNLETNGFVKGQVPHFVFGDTYSGTGQRIFYHCNGKNSDGLEYIKYGLDQDVEFSRTVECTAEGTDSGEYRVKLIAVDENLKVVHIYGTSEPLVVMEFDVKFLPSKDASLLTEDQLEEISEKEFDILTKKKDEDLTSEERTQIEHYKQSNAYLDNSKFITYISGVDFDEYRYLEDGDATNDYILSFDKGKRLKWPLDWEESSYAFAFSYEEDFHLSYDHNSYTIANHSSVVPYHRMVVDKYETEGLYDRLYYDTKKKNDNNPKVDIEKGYYLYVNGQGDPGVMARLKIDDLCQGTKLYVTGWIADFSGDETANLIINLQAVLKDKSVKVLNSFTTGYICKSEDENDGKWMQFYYSFIPEIEGFLTTDLDHYEVTFENNCMNSAGADYAIDDLRIYVARPEVFAEQLEPICDGEKSAPFRVETSYEVMMNNLGLKLPKTADEGKPYKFYYTFVDKEKYKTAIDAGDSYTNAFNNAVLEFPYDEGAESNQWYGTISFNTFYKTNPAYGEEGYENVAYQYKIDDDPYLVFNANPTDDEDVAGKTYYIIMKPVSADEDEEPSKDRVAEWFDLLEPCSKFTTFTFQSAGLVKIDGVAYPNLNDLTLCANQSPVIQIDIYGRNEGDESLHPLQENAFLDWFEGTMKEFNETTDDDNNTLIAVLNAFRDEYPDTIYASGPIKGSYTTSMRKLLMELSEPGENGRPKLTLHKRSFAFPQLTLNDNEKKTLTVVAVPSAAYDEPQNVIVCTAPLKVEIRISNESPSLKHGFYTNDITYPEGMSDVPLRIGLDQLNNVSTTPYESFAGTFKPRLQLPIRYANAVTDGVTELERADDDILYLAWTDDPDYETLYEKVEGEIEEDDGYEPERISVGEVKDIVAHTSGKMVENALDVVFYKSFIFKEGYTYKLQYHFQEQDNDIQESIDRNGECSGQQLLTIKVVPTYQKWSGQARGEDGEIDGTNLNWNNDDNWRRVSSGELLRTSNDEDDYTTDGSNSNRKSFAPLDFTKVIVGTETASYPSLYQMVPKQVTISDGTNSETFQWSANPDAGAHGKSTALIQFDMAARYKGDNVGCRPWYGQTCDEIHFEAGGRILNQHELMYNKAWVDMEIDKNIWHTLASPLQSVVAGDFYLPTKGGRQNTELFSEINYSTTDNNRFKPAVYQRAWNKSEANVYQIDGSSTNVAVRTTWSNVYNEVSESYSPGAGFSIKADLSNVEGTVPEKALFRLPKADTDYKYFENGKPSTGQTESGSSDNFSRDSIYRLTPTTKTVSISAAAPSKYFLVGNPFMACLDMKIFFDENPGLNKKYWMIDGNGNNAYLLDDEGVFEIPPMGGFFVETKGSDNKVNISFTPDMMTLGTSQATSFEARPTSRGGSGSTSGIRIEASTDGKVSSQALIRVDEHADNGYKESEDVSLLYDPTLCGNPMVYTIAGNMATSINSVAGINSIEVGVIAKADAATTLRFEGDELDRGDYILFDAETGERDILSVGYSLTIEGASAGRYYIIGSSTGTDAIDALPALEMRLEDRQVILRKPGGNSPLTIAVYDTMGTLVKKASADNDQLTITLDPGLWIVAGECDGERISNKYFVR